MTIRPLPESPFVTTAEVAALFRVDPKTVTRWARTGRLTMVRTPSGYGLRYLRTEVDALLAAQTEPRA